MIVDPSKKISIHFSDSTTGKYISLRDSTTLLPKEKPISLYTFEALGTKSYFYFAPKEQGEFIMKSITFKEIKEFPYAKKKDEQYPPYKLSSRIIWGEDGDNHKINDPFVGKVKIKGRGWEYIVLSNKDGVFNFSVTDRGEFILSAWGGNKWSEYSNKFSINSHDDLFEKRGDIWVTISSLEEVKLK